MEANYRINRSAVTDEQGVEHIFFGISVYRGGESVPMRTVYDIFSKEADASRLAGLCTALGLAPEHLDDVIADSMASL